MNPFRHFRRTLWTWRSARR